MPAGIREVQMLLSVTICLGVAVYCFANGLVIAGVTALLGLIPGPGIIPLLISSVILFINGFQLAALLPLLVIANNLRVAFKTAGPDPE